MKHKLPILSIAALFAAVLAAVAGAPAPGRDESHRRSDSPPHPTEAQVSASGNELLSRAADALERYPTLSGRLRQQIQLFGHQLAGTGTYRQQWGRGGFRFRFDLRVATDPVASHYLALSDGRFLWLRRQSQDETRLQRVDLKSLRAAANSPRRRPTTSPIPSMLGGLPSLLRRIERLYEFSRQDTMRIGREQVPVVVIRGRWKPAMLRRMFVPQLVGEPTLEQLEELPEPVPHEIEIVLGQDDQLPLFPYRIRCFRMSPGGATVTMSLEFFELSRSDPISPHVFRYDPGNEEMEDGTDEYREMTSVP